MTPLSPATKALLLKILAERKVSPMLRAEFAKLAVDRSCATCAFQSSRLCHNFGVQQIPDEFFPKGCESYDDKPTPF